MDAAAVVDRRELDEHDAGREGDQYRVRCGEGERGLARSTGPHDRHEPMLGDRVADSFEVDVASEFRYREPPIPARTTALFVSQSGETADTLAALRYCTGKASTVLSVVNVPESSIARESDLALPIYAGVEIGVASTKAFTCQLVVLLLLALKAAADRGEMDADTLADHISALRGMPNIISTALGANAQMHQAALKLAQARDVLFLGRGLMYPLALEGALNLKEISYIHAEAYAAGEL